MERTLEQLQQDKDKFERDVQRLVDDFLRKYPEVYIEIDSLMIEYPSGGAPIVRFGVRIE